MAKWSRCVFNPPTGSSGRTGSTNSQINRRCHLGYPGAGAGATGWNAANVGAIGVDDGVAIETVRSDEGEHPTEVVSEDWLVKVEASRRAFDTVVDEFWDAPWVGDVSRQRRDVSGDRDSSDLEIRVGATDVEAGRRALPAGANEFP